MKFLTSINGITRRFDSLARQLLLFVVFILPLVVFPNGWFSLPSIKMGVLAIGISVSLLLWTIARFKEHEVTLPKTKMCGALVLLFAGYFLSAILSGHIITSLVGFGYEIGTVLAIAVFIGALSAGSVLVRSVADFMKLQRTMLVSFFIVAVFQLARIFIGGDAFLPSLFSSDATASLMGSWSDLAVLAGFSSLTALTALALFSSKRVKIGMYALLLVSVALLALVNISTVWATLALMSFLLLIYIFSDASYDKETGKFEAHIPWVRMIPGIALFVLSIVFMVSGASIGAWTTKTFSVSSVDVRPSWAGTVNVGSAVYKNDLLFGVGPNAFSDAWAAHKPAGINQTTFWNINFNSGVGFIPTAFIEGGLVVGLLWVLFLFTFIYLGVKMFSRRIVQPSMMYITLSGYIGALYLWILMLVYVPQTVVLAYLFILTGATLAAAKMAGVIGVYDVRSESSYASGLGLTGALVAVFVISGAVLVTTLERVNDDALLARAVHAAQSGNYTKARTLITSSEKLIRDTRMAQLRVNIGEAEVSSILKEDKGKDKKAVAEQQKRFRAAISKTISAARNVVAEKPNDFNAWIQLGDVYAQLIPIKVSGAKDSAVQAYTTAATINVSNPIPYMRLAGLSLQEKDYKKAKEYAAAALKLKNNYTDAYYLLSQVAIAEKKTDEAIKATESAVVLRPNNAGLLFQLGILQFSTQAYDKAVTVLERAVAINPNYSNALYFLGLAYDKTGKAKEALAVFKRVSKLNPDNKDIKAIVVALESGKSAYSVLKTKNPVTYSKTLPVKSK